MTADLTLVKAMQNAMTAVCDALAPLNMSQRRVVCEAAQDLLRSAEVVVPFTEDDEDALMQVQKESRRG